MSKKRKLSEKVCLPFFVWSLRSRNGVWQADGRGNTVNPGRHSLGTKDYDEAMAKLQLLDRVQAVALGIADPGILASGKGMPLFLEDGKETYLKHAARPLIAGGVAEKSKQRYEAVLDKFVPWAKTQNLTCWNQIKRQHLCSYADWLQDEGYAYRTQFLELTTIKQAVNYFIFEQLLPIECKIHLLMRKASGTDTYSYRSEQVRAMLSHCKSRTGLAWMRLVIAGLSSLECGFPN